ncbi:alcohol dehydrogenase catalytic domain-containing protein [Gimesia benthica]|uniref:Alcohol dehydrogenase catalytic domain-containing protein n=1 Tax=Gimesia benthica TaxID=2608982 RepID=A0A6I6AG51_9PLAN|nr:zinc-binding dehydrogenase [Gimesia benthica]QGQ24081.1 alcohol dehydrogenase catalytic domain-containing protein [Gimesia benthica]
MQTAVVNYAPEADSVELQEIPVPEIGPDEVLLEVAAVGVCGSDLHQWTADHSWPVNYPVVLGHEFAGTISRTGELVRNWSIGDRVVSETAAIIDPDNPLSREGRYNLDPTRKGFGYGVNGAMTSFVRVPARCLHHVPDSLPLEKAALTEPCCVAFNAVVMNGDIQPGDRVVVFGPGPIGLLCAAMARLQGAEVAVVGLERDQGRLEIAAREYGCEPIIAGLDEWSVAVDGLGVNGVVDAAGVSVTLKKSLEIVRPGGWISKVGWGPQPLGFSLDPLVQKNIRLQGSFSHNWPIWERVIRLLTTEQLNIDPIIGGTWSLSDWHTAFETMHSGEIVKAVLTP